MATLPFPVYDADHHLYEPAEAFLRHLPKQYSEDFFYVERNGRTKLVVGGVYSEYIPNPTFTVVAAPGTHEKYYRSENTEGLTMRELAGKPIRQPDEWKSGAGRLKLLDQLGIHSCLLFPTMASVIEARLAHKPKTMAALFHSVDEYLHEEYGFARDNRLFTVPMISLSDFDAAMVTLDLAIKRGARLVGIRPAPVPIAGGTTSFGYERFDPFWARVSDAGIFVAMHASDSGYDAIARMWQGAGTEYQPFVRNNLQSILDGLGRAISDAIAVLICHGVFDRHPKIRIASVENGASWVEPLIYRLKRAYGQTPNLFKKDPVEQFHKHVFVAPFYEDDTMKLRKSMPVERMLFGSDYPHPEGLAEPLDYINEFKGYSPAELKTVFHDNLKGLLDGKRD